jgi:hypothetical protein
MMILSKPCPIRYKPWCIPDRGLILDWLFHRKGTKKGLGPQGLDPQLKEPGFNPTQGVV